jgi:dethiobiotin synthase
LRGFFVTGTDTGVGTTVACAALMHALRGRTRVGPGSDRGLTPLPLRYWKPVQTGIEQDDDTQVVRTLGACTEDEVLDVGIRLPRPLSPHLSAQLAGTTLSLDRIVTPLVGDVDTACWIVEGAGGVLVPLNDSDFMIDLMVRLAMPVIVVARSGLGTINHTLLTLEALEARRLTVAGVLMVGEPNEHNRAAIESRGRVAVIGQLPRLDPLTADRLRDAAAHIDALPLRARLS